MIKLFVADLDGCISIPFQSPKFSELAQIRKYSEQAKTEEKIPYLTICTGRPLPYAEAVAQWLDVKLPIIFESGGGIFNTVTNHITWSPEYKANKQDINAIRLWVEKHIVSKYDGIMPEFAKQTDVGLVHPEESVIDEIYPKIKEYVTQNYHQFDVHYTEVSVNIILKKSNKGTGVETLSELTDFALNEMAYIGDGTNDIPAMQRVKAAYAPLNCRDEVAQHAQVVDKKATSAVLEVYENLIRENG